MLLIIFSRKQTQYHYLRKYCNYLGTAIIYNAPTEVFAKFYLPMDFYLVEHLLIPINM